MEKGAFHILIVDDEMIVRRSLAEILRLEGFHVQTAPSGEEAIQILQEQTIDLVFLDLKMPGIGGLAVMRFVKEKQPNCQIILLTAHGSLESAIEAIRSGAQDYLLKPSSPEQIIACAAKAFQNRQEQIQRLQLLSQIEASLVALRERDDSSPGKASLRPGLQISEGVMVDFEKRLVWNNDHEIKLTPTEGKLLQTLFENPERVFTHRELVSRIHGYQTTDREASGILRPLVSRLREKLRKFPGGENWVSSVRSTGYIFNKQT